MENKRIPSIDTFLDHYEETALRTARLVRLFDDKDMGIRPGGGSMSTSAQIEHILASANFMRGLLAEPQLSPELFQRKFDVKSVADALHGIEQMINEIRQAAAECPTERWEQVVAPWGEQWRWPRGELAWLMIEHEIHHCGQLHVYARVAGKVPPMLYEPVTRQVLKT